MANNVVSIDLGAYSVKMAVAEAGFRQTTITEIVERPLPPGDRDDALERATAVAAQLLAERDIEPDAVYVAVPGHLLHTRILEFGFRHLKRSDLEKAVGSELEGMLPYDLDEIVYSFDSLPRDLGEDRSPQVRAPQNEVTDDEPTFVQDEPKDDSPPPGIVAAPTSGMRVFACAMPRERARELLMALSRDRLAPRSLVVGTSGFARLVERIGGLQAAHTGGQPVAVIDMGHDRTDLCVVKGGRVIFSRSVERGGRDVTAAIARTWNIPFEEAESAKHSDGFIASETEPPPSEAWARIHEVVSTELEPLARDLRRTLRACRAETGAAVEAALLVGGGSRLRGLPSYLAEQLQMPVGTLGQGDAEQLVGPQLAQQGAAVDVAACATGVALEAATGRVLFDLRQGDLAYKADFSFLRQKVAHLAAAGLIIVAFIAANAYASLYKLRSDETALEERLALESVAVTGKQLSASEVIAEVGPAEAIEKSPLPKMTAYDILNAINEKLPARGEVTLDVKSIDIRPGTITLQATAASPSEIGQIEKALASIECFESVSKPNISSGPDDVKNFSVSIKTNCMQRE